MQVTGKLERGDRVLVTLISNVVRSAIFLGRGPSPVDAARDGVLLRLTDGGEVVQWIDCNYVRSIEVTLAAGGGG